MPCEKCGGKVFWLKVKEDDNCTETLESCTNLTGYCISCGKLLDFGVEVNV